MNNEIIKQSLVEAFEVIKDSWELRSDAIINCIVETEVYDGRLAIEMWTYVLKRNEHLLTNGNDIKHLLDDVLIRFFEKYDYAATMERYCKVMLEHVALHVVEKDDLIKMIFEKTTNAGWCGYKYGGYNEFSPAFIACILLQGNASVAKKLFKAMSSNKNFVSITMGQLLIKSVEYINCIKRNTLYMEKEYLLSQEVKESLFESLGYIADKESRAECTIAILSL